MLALPGSCYLYQGEELGLPDATSCRTRFARTRPGDDRGTPSVAGTAVASRCPASRRAGLRVRALGPELAAAQPPSFRELAVDPAGRRPRIDARARIGRICRLAGSTVSVTVGCIGSTDIPDDALALVNAPADNDRPILLLANFGPEPVPLPDGRPDHRRQ